MGWKAGANPLEKRMFGTDFRVTRRHQLTNALVQTSIDSYRPSRHLIKLHAATQRRVADGVIQLFMTFSMSPKRERLSEVNGWAALRKTGLLSLPLGGESFDDHARSVRPTCFGGSA